MAPETRLKLVYLALRTLDGAAAAKRSVAGLLAAHGYTECELENAINEYRALPAAQQSYAFEWVPGDTPETGELLEVRCTHGALTSSAVAA